MKRRKNRIIAIIPSSSYQCHLKKSEYLFFFPFKFSVFPVAKFWWIPGHNYHPVSEKYVNHVCASFISIVHAEWGKQKHVRVKIRRESKLGERRQKEEKEVGNIRS